MEKYYLLGLLLMGMISSSAQTRSFEQTRDISGFSHPESVVLDTDRDVLYVSNMGGKTDKDGFISRVSRNGKILDTVWVGELDDPKGLLVKNNTLYVTDVTDLVEINIDKGLISKRINIMDAQSLNDITEDRNGNIYISDLVGNKIYQMKSSGEITTWMSDENLKRPNGLLVRNNDLFVASWGSDKPGKLLRVDRDSRQIFSVSETGLGNLDGIQELQPGIFLLSDWGTGSIYQIGNKGAYKKVLTTAKSSGDILYIEKTKELVVPMNHQNALWWYLIP